MTFLPRWVFGLGVWLCAALHVNQANAQVTPSITLYLAGITHSVPRTGYRTNKLLNYSDCVEDDVITFPLAVTGGASGYQLQAWAGINCTDATVRALAQGQCWLLYSDSTNSSSNANAVLDIHVRSILAGYTSLSASAALTDGTDAGTAPTIPAGTLINAGPEACLEPNALESATAVTLYFMLVDPSTDSVVGIPATWNASAKLLGPPPPDTLTAAIGDRELVLHFSYEGDQQSDPTINGYQFYCDPQPGLAAAADAGLAPTDAGVAAQACGAVPSQVLIPAAPHLNLPPPCGTALLAATGGTVTGLVNDVPYDVAVAALDTYENIGPLSRLACDVPEPSKNSGDVRACSFSPRRAKAPMFLLGVLVACCWLRRRGR